MGGASRRMGRDKGLLEIGGETLLKRTTRVVAAVAQEILIVGRTEIPAEIVDAASSEELLTLRAVPDDVAGAGPLAGIAAGLRRAAHPWVLVVACDFPLLNPAVLSLLVANAPGFDAVVPRIAHDSQPLQAVYSRSVLPVVEERLAARRLRVKELLPSLRIRWMNEDELRAIDPSLLALANVNTPEQWKKLLELL